MKRINKYIKTLLALSLGAASLFSNTYEKVEVNAAYEPISNFINFLTFEAVDVESTITLNFSSGTNVQIGYPYVKLSNLGDFSNYTAGDTITLQPGEAVCFKGDDVETSSSKHFVMTGKIKAFGSVTSLTDGCGYDLCNTLSPGCYSSMFEDCTSLISLPQINAKSIPDSACVSMFKGCTGIKNATALNFFKEEVEPLRWTSVGDDACYQMFMGCTSLCEAPCVPTTDLSNRCYEQMFRGCTNITRLPTNFNNDVSITLADDSFSKMFYECTNLTLYASGKDEFKISFKLIADKSDYYADMFNLDGASLVDTNGKIEVYYASSAFDKTDLTLDNENVYLTEDIELDSQITINNFVSIALCGYSLTINNENPFIINGGNVVVLGKTTADKIDYSVVKYLKNKGDTTPIKTSSVFCHENVKIKYTPTATNLTFNGFKDSSNDATVTEIPGQTGNSTYTYYATWKHVCNSIDFDKDLKKYYDSLNNLTEGNYYLSEDLDLSSTSFKGITIKSGVVNLCLNDKLLTGCLDGSLFTVNSGATLNIYDCGDTVRTWRLVSYYNFYVYDETILSTDSKYRETTGGVITNGGIAFDVYGTLNLFGGNIVANCQRQSYENANGGDSTINVYGSFTMHNGLIAGNSCDGLCGAVSIEDGGSFEIKNGSIKENYGKQGAIYVYDQATFTISGGKIYDNSGYLPSSPYQIFASSSSGVKKPIINLYGGEIYSTLDSAMTGGINAYKTINIKGNPKVYNNKFSSSSLNNIVMRTDTKIYVVGEVSDTAELHILFTPKNVNFIENTTYNNLENVIIADKSQTEVRKMEVSTGVYSYYQGPKTYTLTYNLNGGTINGNYYITYEYGYGVTLPTNVTISEKTFAGWYEESDFSGSKVTSYSATATGNKTLYAKFVYRIDDLYFTVDNIFGMSSRYPIYPNSNEYMRFIELTYLTNANTSTRNTKNVFNLYPGESVHFDKVVSRLTDLEELDKAAYNNIYNTLRSLSNLNSNDILNASVFKENVYLSTGEYSFTACDYGLIFGYVENEGFIYYGFNETSMYDGGIATLVLFNGIDNLVSTYSYITPSNKPLTYDDYLNTEILSIETENLKENVYLFGGTAKDDNNQPIANSSITVSIAGEDFTKTTDQYGNFLIDYYTESADQYYEDGYSEFTYDVTYLTNTYVQEKYYYVFSISEFDVYENKSIPLYSTIAYRDKNITLPSEGVEYLVARKDLIAYHFGVTGIGVFFGDKYYPGDQYKYANQECNDFLQYNYFDIIAEFEYITKQFTGTELTGTTTVVGSVDNPIYGDTYLNTSTLDLYNYNGLKWVHIGNMKGEKGDKGDTGETGATGASGKSITSIAKTSTLDNVDTYTITYSDSSTSTFTVTNGINGQDGTNGIDGQNGQDGTTPTISINTDGYWVINGEASTVKAIGTNGTNGTNGTDGINPKLQINSAYNYWEVSYDNGTTWTSLGIKATGDKGEKGDQGEPGKSIVSIAKTSTIENVDTYTITYSDSSTSTFTVINGINGTNGTNGQNGTDGITPTISINNEGYWVINGEVSTVKALGVNGQDGIDGTNGSNGSDGTNGTNGVSPKLRINSETNMWEVTYDEGTTWISLEINATNKTDNYINEMMTTSTFVTFTAIISGMLNLVFISYLVLSRRKPKIRLR